MNDINAETTAKKDKIEVIGESLVQHGKLSDRVYLMRYSENDDPDIIINSIINLADQYRYSKIFTKVPSVLVPCLIERGFTIEAAIPGFYFGSRDAFFMSKFFDETRKFPDSDALRTFKQIMLEFNEEYIFVPDNKKSVSLLTPNDAKQISALYSTVFASYPFPIHDPSYIVDTMKTHVRYFGIRQGKRLIAVSSAEIDEKYQNAEMTDFATDPEFRGRKLASYLLYEMEQQLSAEGIRTAYTIARLHSPAMNITFLKNRYTYSGTLVKNTNIAGKIESMNVLYKSLNN